MNFVQHCCESSCVQSLLSLKSCVQKFFESSIFHIINTLLFIFIFNFIIYWSREVQLFSRFSFFSPRCLFCFFFFFVLQIFFLFFFKLFFFSPNFSILFLFFLSLLIRCNQQCLPCIT